MPFLCPIVSVSKVKSDDLWGFWWCSGRDCTATSRYAAVRPTACRSATPSSRAYAPSAAPPASPSQSATKLLSTSMEVFYFLEIYQILRSNWLQYVLLIVLCVSNIYDRFQSWRKIWYNTGAASGAPATTEAYGVCSGFDQAGYFHTALNLRAKVNLLSHLSNKGTANICSVGTLMFSAAYWASVTYLSLRTQYVAGIVRDEFKKYSVEDIKPAIGEGIGLPRWSGAARSRGVPSSSTRSTCASTRAQRRSSSALCRRPSHAPPTCSSLPSITVTYIGPEADATVMPMAVEWLQSFTDIELWVCRWC